MSTAATKNDQKSTTALQELLFSLSVELDVMEKNSSRLHSTTNAMELDPPAEHANKIGNPSKFSEGLLNDLNRHLERFKALNESFNYQLNRIEKYI